MPVEVTDYDPAWVERYEMERAALAEALAPHVLRIEHVGSTSVPGLAAKPIVDIALVVRTLAVLPDIRIRLHALGYGYRGEGGVPLRHFFRKPDISKSVVPRIAHLHVTQPGSPDFAAHLLFRDHLRRSAAARSEYEALKRDLAATSPDSMIYTEAKGPFIRRTLDEAAGQ